jgi:outer membrane protein TolC
MNQNARKAMAMVLALSAGLAGCAVGPRYAKPTTNLAPFHNLAGANATTPAFPAPALESWWTGFNDPMLVTVVLRPGPES